MGVVFIIIIIIIIITIIAVMVVVDVVVVMAVALEVTVRFTLEQSTKTQRWGGGSIPLLCSTPRPSPFAPGKKYRNPYYRRLGGPHSRRRTGETRIRFHQKQ